MTRIVHLLDDGGMGGVTRVLADHLPRLAAAGDHRIRLVDATRPPSGGTTVGACADADISVVHFTLNWAKLRFMSALRAARRRPRIVVVEHSYTAAYERLNVPVPWRFRAMLRLGYAMADRVVAVSRAQADWIAGARLTTSRKLAVIPQAVGTDGLGALPLPQGGPHPLRLGAYGRYTAQKGFDVLIEAMRRVSPAVATLELAGDGPDRGALEDAARGLPHVAVVGPVDGPAAFLPRVDAVAVPSRWEAFGLVALEARAAGRPVLAAATDGLVEQIDPAWGTLVRAGDADALADAIGHLAGRDLRAMGASARRSADGAAEATAAGWRALLRDVAASRGIAAAPVSAPGWAAP